MSTATLPPGSCSIITVETPPSLRWSHERQQRLVTDSCVSAGGTRDFQPWTIHQRFPTDGLELAAGLVADRGDATEAKSRFPGESSGTLFRPSRLNVLKTSRASLAETKTSEVGFIHRKPEGLAGLGRAGGGQRGRSHNKANGAEMETLEIHSKRKAEKHGFLSNAPEEPRERASFRDTPPPRTR